MRAGNRARGRRESTDCRSSSTKRLRWSRGSSSPGSSTTTFTARPFRTRSSGSGYSAAINVTRRSATPGRLRRRIRAGKSTIPCLFCESPIPIWDEVEQRFGDPDNILRVRSLEAAGNASRSVEVGLTTASAKREIEEYDTFLAYNSADADAVSAVATALRGRGINPWLDRWCVPPGRRFMHEIQRVFHTVKSVTVFLGTHGIGPWEDLEIQAAIEMFVNRGCPVIPVTLPGREPGANLPISLGAPDGFVPGPPGGRDDTRRPGMGHYWPATSTCAGCAFAATGGLVGGRPVKAILDGRAG